MVALSLWVFCVTYSLSLYRIQAADLSFSTIGDIRTWDATTPNFQSTAFEWTKHNVIKLSKAREEANIAYFIQASDSSIPMISRLMDRLHHPKNLYAIHCDKKIPAYRVVKLMADIKEDPRYSNVYFMERESVTYRGVTMILNNIAAINMLLDKGDWDYFINISASDYPLVAPDVPRKLLALPHIQEKKYNFFSISPRDQWDERKLDRYDDITIDMAMGMSDSISDSRLLISDAKNPLRDALNYEYAYSEGWFILTRAASKFMVSSSHAQRILLTMAFSQDPSEHYYLSVFWNHPDYNKTIIPHSLRTVFWEHNGVLGGQHPFTIDETLDDDGEFALWPRLSGSPHWFARKFKHPDSAILDYIDENMSGMGDSVNDTAVQESRERVDMNLQWLCGLLNDDE